MSTAPRMILSRGSKALRPDLGRIIKDARQGKIGDGDRMKQEVLAVEIGITRTALSRIESGKAWPRPDTLDRIMVALELDWKDMAYPGESGGRTRRFDETIHGKRQLDLGERLRVARKAAGLSLDQLASRSRLSAAQISRIERGECGRSSAFAIHPDTVDRIPENQWIIFTDPVLAELIK